MSYLRIEGRKFPARATEEGFEPVAAAPCDGCHTDLREARTLTDRGYPELECPGCGKRHYVFAILDSSIN